MKPTSYQLLWNVLPLSCSNTNCRNDEHSGSGDEQQELWESAALDFSELRGHFRVTVLGSSAWYIFL